VAAAAVTAAARPLWVQLAAAPRALLPPREPGARALPGMFRRLSRAAPALLERSAVASAAALAVASALAVAARSNWVCLA
jgi:hypothetical protein